MSTLRISNIEAKSVPASATIDEKVKITNSSGDVLVFLDGKTSGITTVGINTTDGNITFDANSNVVVTGIITATKFVGTIEPTNLTVGGDLTIPDKIIHSGDTNTSLRFPSADTITAETAGVERLRITSGGDVVIGHSAANAKLHIASGTSSAVGDATNPALQIGSAANYRFAIHTTNEQAIIANKNGDDGIAFHTKTASGGSFGEALRITSDGNIDIATGTLTISNDIKSSDDDFYVYSYKGGSDGQVRSGIQYDGNSQRLRFFTGTNERLRITSAGLVDIFGSASQSTYIPLLLQNSASAGTGSNPDIVKLAFGSSGFTKASIRAAVYGEGFMTFHTNNDTEKLRITAGGNVSINDGNLVVASGHGIDFSATADAPLTGASMSNELLDDYEEGSFTPSGFCDGGSVTNQSSRYTKIGRVVNIYIYVSNINIPNTACQWKLYGLPFTVKSGHYPALTIGYTGAGNLPSDIRFLCRATTNWIYTHTTAGSASSPTNQTIRAYLQGHSLLVTGYYFTDS